MKVAFGAKKSFDRCYSVPSEGQFSLETNGEKPLHWDHCREQFLGRFKEDVSGFYFSHKIDKSIDIAAFILKFENILSTEIKDFHFSRFSRTERETVLWVEPSDFWKNCILKKSLLTLLLRCGANYEIIKDNFDNALFGIEYSENKYVRDTKNAVVRFLFGFTKFSGKINQTIQSANTSTLIRHGWHAEFDKNSVYDVRKKLIRASDDCCEISFLESESLWG
jgi:hypothetical protein